MFVNLNKTELIHLENKEYKTNKSFCDMASQNDSQLVNSIVNDTHPVEVSTGKSTREELRKFEEELRKFEEEQMEYFEQKERERLFEERLSEQLDYIDVFISRIEYADQFALDSSELILSYEREVKKYNELVESKDK